MDKYLKKLELDKIIELLRKFCITEIASEKLNTITPEFKASTVKRLLSETTQAIKLQSEAGTCPISPIKDFSKISKLIEAGTFLSCANLLAVGHILKVSRELKDYFANCEAAASLDSIEAYFSNLYTNQALEERIINSILDENTVADNASSTLNTIRRKKQNLESSVKDTLHQMIHSSYSKYIMDDIVTIRNDRYVIPVKIEYKENVKGFVHDVSYSGSTVFIEPMSIFEMNNQIQNLQIEENVEIERFLRSLSELLVPIKENITQSVNAICNIDLVFARAKFSIEYNCVEPIINDKKIIDLKQARHPLIDPKSVVPVSIEVGSKYSSLIITGPNTGGKTVCLKTTGLLCLMAYMGLHIPAKDGSTLFVFDNVFADIGDEQSIQESLSTFSSHMLNIIDIYNHASSNSLVLVDELGSGTDPVEGANLAISILEYFHKLGATTLATTHYPEIKNYALVTDGFENASSEFDIENLKPTYKLLVGVPGKSNAFEITKRLGMPDSILSKAKSLMKSDNISVEELIKNIYDDKVEIEKEKEKIKQNSNQIEMLRKSLDDKWNSLNSKEADIIEKAKIQAREMLLKSKKEANSIITELNELHSSSSKDALKTANALRNRLNDEIKDISKTENSNETNNEKVSKVEVGMNVIVNSLNKHAVVLSLPNKSGDVQVQIGNMKMNVNLNDLSPSKQNTSTNQKDKINPKRSQSTNSILKSKTASTEINVIGQTVDEAIFVIDKFLDDSALAGLKNVRIVHGKGTGKLRKGIHNFLSNHPHVSSFRLGTFGEGEMGVTVVEIK